MTLRIKVSSKLKLLKDFGEIPDSFCFPLYSCLLNYSAMLHNKKKLSQRQPYS